MLKSTRILTKIIEPLTKQQVKDFVLGAAKTLHELEIVYTGFVYEPGVGIYLFGPRDSLEQLNNHTNEFEDFDAEEYFSNFPDNARLFLINYMNPQGPVLEEMVKK